MSRNKASFILVVIAVLYSCAPRAAGQSVPPNIVVEGVPEIPSDLVRKMKPYRDIRSAVASSWHPVKREMLISTRLADTAQVHVVNMPGGARRQITFFSEPVAGASYCPQEASNCFLFGMDEGGSEFYQLYRFDWANGSHHMLTDGKSRNSSGPFSNKGDRMAFTSTRRNGRDFDVYVLDLDAANSTRMVYEAEGAWYPLDWSPDDRRLLMQRYVSINESYVYVLDLDTGVAEKLLPPDETKVSYGDARWSSDGKSVYVTSDHESEFVGLGRFDLDRGTLTALTSHIPWDIEYLAMSADRSLLAFASNEDGISRIHVWDTVTGEELPQPRLPLGQIFSLEFHKKLNELSITLMSSTSTADAYSYDLKAQALTRWTFSEAGGLDTERFPETELIHYPTFDAVEGKPRMIPAFLRRPPSRFKPPYPVLIDIHGGPESQVRPQLNSSYELNELGIATILPNVRGSAGYGKTYLTLDNGFQREDSVKDIGALLDWIKTQPYLDSSRIAVTGGSYGGFMSLAALAHYSDRIRCGIDIVGISNFVTFLESTQEYRRDLRRAEYGDERDPKMRSFLESVSPLNNVDKIKVPLLVAQGQNDPRVPVTESEQMVKKLRQNGGTVWYVMAKDEGHGFRKKQNRDYLSYATILFLEEFLLD